MECPNCRASNPEGSSFCASCGTSLRSAIDQMTPAFGLAGRGSRLAAVIIDGIIYGGSFVFLAISAALLRDMVFVVFVALAIPVAIFIYQMVLLTKYGQTLGKKALGIRIVKMDTQENGGFVPNVLLRLVVNGLLGLIPFYSIVDILFIFGSDRRCIHDWIAGTQVIEA